VLAERASVGVAPTRMEQAASAKPPYLPNQPLPSCRVPS